MRNSLNFSMTGSSVLASVYGYEVHTSDDPLVEIVETAMNGFNQAASPASGSSIQCADFNSR